MLFNSFEFIVFVAVFFAAWPMLRKNNTSRWIYLVTASFIFYGWWDWRFLFLIMGSGFIDFFAGLAMERWPAHRKPFLVASVCGNIGSLAIFKYMDFFLGNLNWAMGAAGLEHQAPMLRIILPVGISFYTFQSMSYTIDIYKGQLRPTHNVFHFFAYLALFPQLVAGPIVRAAHLLPQLEKNVPTTEKQRWEGMALIVNGMFKKVVVADTLAPFINEAFATATPVESCAYWWGVMIMFSFQIYCDFSGYSDIARGLAKWMGYDFPVNFDHPYIARSVREFWSRWHISLSTWFRDYVYIPLGGSRGGKYANLRNMWITMVISGFWHGAAWTFVVWGALHALYLSIERLTDWPKKIRAIPGGGHLSVLIVFVLVLISWVFFRAESFSQAATILTHLVDLAHPNLAALRAITNAKVLALLALMAGRQAYVYFGMDTWRWHDTRWAAHLHTAAAALLLAACVLFRGPGAAFIYFQF